MNLKSLRAFRLVVTQGSLAAAAEALHLSQPAVSRLIALLEDETRLNLFDRTRRSLTLTETGETFYRETRHILDGIDELPHIAANVRSGTNRPLRVVTGPRFGLAVVPPALTMMRRENPDLKCIVDVLPRFELENKSGIARYDLGVASLPVSHSLLPLENQPLCRLRMEAILCEAHPLAQKDSLTAADLAGQPIIGMKQDFFGRQSVDELFRSAGVRAAYAVETTSSLLACQMARDGAGIAIMDRLSATAVNTAGMAVRPLEPAHWLLYGYICHKGQILTDDAVMFLDCIKRCIEGFRDQSPENAHAVEPLWDGS